MEKLKNLNKIKSECAAQMLGMYRKANAGHIGSSLSCLDILVYIFFKKMKKNDAFILSKGHAAAALYTVLARSGRMDSSLLDSFYKDGTFMAAHPPCGGKISSIPFGTGSLGHGLSIASGIALSGRYTGKNFSVYCVLSEGDCNEGSTWEAALFAAQHKLSNLTVVIDNNGLQGFGRTEDVLGLKPLKDKWKAFNFDVFEAKDGNDFKSLEKAFIKAGSKASGRPKCIIASTVKGSGVSFMENSIDWHYLPMSEEQYKKALREKGGV
jgi:transketolase